MTCEQCSHSQSRLNTLHRLPPAHNAYFGNLEKIPCPSMTKSVPDTFEIVNPLTLFLIKRSLSSFSCSLPLEKIRFSCYTPAVSFRSSDVALRSQRGKRRAFLVWGHAHATVSPVMRGGMYPPAHDRRHYLFACASLCLVRQAIDATHALWHFCRPDSVQAAHSMLSAKR